MVERMKNNEFDRFFPPHPDGESPYRRKPLLNPSTPFFNHSVGKKESAGMHLVETEIF